jgi:hypothetical protein
MDFYSISFGQAPNIFQVSIAKPAPKCFHWPSYPSHGRIEKVTRLPFLTSLPLQFMQIVVTNIAQSCQVCLCIIATLNMMFNVVQLKMPRIIRGPLFT